MSKTFSRRSGASDIISDDWHVLPTEWKDRGRRDYSDAGINQVFRAARIRLEQSERQIVVRYVDAVKEQTIINSIECQIGRDDNGRLVVDPQPATECESFDVVRAIDPQEAEPATQRDLEAVWRRWRDELSHTNASPPQRGVSLNE